MTDGLIFCADPHGESFHVFVVSSLDSGEMLARPCDYQDPAMNDPHHLGDYSFAELVQELADRTKDALS